MAEVDPMKRRGFLTAGLTSLALPALGAAPASGAFPFSLFETAGLRRFGYPVHTVLPEVSLPPNTRFRLIRNGRPVPAQFRKFASNGRERVALEFNASPGPLDTEQYVVEFGESVEPGPGPRPGTTVKSVGDDFLVEHGAALKFVVPGNLLGFLKSVGNGKREYLQGASHGLSIRLKDGRSLRLGEKGPEGLPIRGTISYEGPQAIGLLFDSPGPDASKLPIATFLELHFPSSKSWVETLWMVEDPEGQVAGLDVDLRLAIEGEPTLVDLGANTTVYGTIRNQERMILTAGLEPEPWVVEKGPADRRERFAVGTSPVQRREGWAHVMDATRCTAIAVDRFGEQFDRIDIEAGGRVRLTRNSAKPEATTPKGPKQMHFWFHFVSMPVQVGAATSPQAMLSPLRVFWEGRSR
jgi:hypothetical protein